MMKFFMGVYETNWNGPVPTGFVLCSRGETGSGDELGPGRGSRGETGSGEMIC